MQNSRIWEQVAGFMQQLRCENLSEKSVVQMPGQKEVQKELEQVQIRGEELLKQMQEKTGLSLEKAILYLAQYGNPKVVKY